MLFLLPSVILSANDIVCASIKRQTTKKLTVFFIFSMKLVSLVVGALREREKMLKNKPFH